MPNTRDLKTEDPIIQAVVMSPPGTGKTWLLCTFPRPNVFDFDGKIGVARNPDFIKRYGLRSIEYEQFFEAKRKQGIATNHIAYDNACRYFDLWMAPGKRDTFDTWGIDSGTSLGEVSRNKAVAVLGGAKRSKTLDNAMQSGLMIMEYQDWGGERSLTEQFIRMVKDSGKHLLVNVHQRETLNENGIVTQVKPLFTGQSADIIPSMFKDVWHLRVQGGTGTMKRILTAEYNGITLARSELGIGTIDDPDYDKIIARIRERQQAAIALSPSATSAVGATPGAQIPATKA